ncbi:hypothetical protein NC99_09310 [Sunxiuqinia dokdonensis]|uniref:Uncharacterized protein n=1 Tax=Sunxiuqinia dokdonensis TaxID=1409788 RepID=A0A0L8VCT5_9BACT|nr:hypothetical protein NC99_09310 [Sunxiuqinia dokdonensis]
MQTKIIKPAAFPPVHTKVSEFRFLMIGNVAPIIHWPEPDQ